ncbi:MAG: four helix bundle protein [Patescibacteria group bacterium]|nr:four helix bundle protein [Patescibacteria group bacterium]
MLVRNVPFFTKSNSKNTKAAGEGSFCEVEPRRIELLNPSTNHGLPRQWRPPRLHESHDSILNLKRKPETQGLGSSGVQMQSVVGTASIANRENMSSRYPQPEFSIINFAIFNQFSMNQVPNKNNYDLEERTARFAEEAVSFSKKIPQNTVTLPLISQFVRASTSVGANYCEAIGASSRKDFRNKIYICKKEIQETKYWLRIISKAEEKVKDDARVLWKEAQELTLIFQKILSTLDKRD